MNRRTFIAAGTWFSACGALSPWFADAADEADAAAIAGAHPTRLALFDSTLAQAGAFVDYTARRRIPAFDIGDDIGALWYRALAPRVARQPVVLLGLARASDFFVLARLALRPGRIVSHATQASQPHGAAPVTFRISA